MPENPLAEYDAQIAAVCEVIAPLQVRLRAIHDERRAYADLLAEDTDDEQVLAALVRADVSQVAFGKFEALVRATTHAGIIGFAQWVPTDEGRPDYADGHLFGPHLGVAPGADPEYLADLAASMYDFAARFNPTPPNHGDFPGMIYAEVLSSDEYASYEIWYEPRPGGRAVILDSTRRYSGDRFEASLVEVLGSASRYAYYRR